MSGSQDAELSRLRTHLNSCFDSFLRRTSFRTPPGDVAVVAPRQAGPIADAVSVNVNLMGGAVFLDDERRVRALAKEIKRLIVEDKRRGIGV